MRRCLRKNSRLTPLNRAAAQQLSRSRIWADYHFRRSACCSVRVWTRVLGAGLRLRKRTNRFCREPGADHRRGVRALLLFGLLLGAVVDRFDRKRLMLGSSIAQALIIAVIPVLAIGGLLRVADIYAVTFVQSTLGIIFDCGEFAAVPSLVGEQELVTAQARSCAWAWGGAGPARSVTVADSRTSQPVTQTG
jgi:hypothetical protein